MTEGIVETEVNGIRTVLAHRPGPLSAGLFFRVGRADETLATSGITHLVEHLALYRHGIGEVHYNGSTAATYTHFEVHGSPDEVVAYFNGVCAALRDLPLERLETEKEILRTEAAGRGHGANHQMALWRYGARGYGLTSYAEQGLWGLGPDAVRAWAQTRFTRENAVLWITSETLPEGLDLTLPSGRRWPAPAPTSALRGTPAYFHGDDGVVVLDAVVRRSTAAGLFADVLGRELFRDLRQKGGYSYTAAADYCARDADFATITALADALPQKQDAVVGGFVDVLAKLRAGRIDQADLNSVRNAKLKIFDTPDLAAARLPSYAVNLLTGHRNMSTETSRAEIEAVTVADLHAVAREVASDALLQVPDRGADWAGFTEAPSQSAGVVTGRRHRALDNDEVTLLIGADGVSMTAPRNQVTVRYDECAVVHAYPDGGRRLTGHDGFSLSVEPTLYRLTPEDVAYLDSCLPAEAVVRMPARDPERIPRPRPKDRSRSGPGPRGAGVPGSAGLWVLTVLSAVVGTFTLILTAAEFDTSLTPTPDWTVLVLFWFFTACCVVPAVRTWLRRRRG
ncbi:M16 family metallopeptidase [Streptomyces sp. SYSU K217416]